jgi:cellobiose phosphorylase
VRADTLVLAPCIPTSWPGFDLTLRYRGAVYEISVRNPAHVTRGVVAALLDGASQPVADGKAVLPLGADQGTHRILITLG